MHRQAPWAPMGPDEQQSRGRKERAGGHAEPCPREANKLGEGPALSDLTASPPPRASGPFLGRKQAPAVPVEAAGLLTQV